LRPHPDAWNNSFHAGVWFVRAQCLYYVTWYPAGHKNGFDLCSNTDRSEVRTPPAPSHGAFRTVHTHVDPYGLGTDRLDFSLSVLRTAAVEESLCGTGDPERLERRWTLWSDPPFCPRIFFIQTTRASCVTVRCAFMSSAGMYVYVDRRPKKRGNS
jgi:hypothetical protein